MAVHRCLIFFYLSFFLSSTGLAYSYEQLDNILHWAAVKTQVPYPSLKAICMTESNLNPTAFVFNDGGKGNHSFGLCQILRLTADRYVGRDPGCLRDFRKDKGLKREPGNCKLFNPWLNALAAGHYLHKQIKRHTGDMIKAIASYNAGSLKICSASGLVKFRRKGARRCVPGEILNKNYVARVEKILAQYSPSLLRRSFHSFDLASQMVDLHFSPILTSEFP